MSRTTKLRYPSFLNQGDKIVILTPATKIESAQLLATRDLIRSWGYRVTVSRNALSNHGCYSGTPKERCADFQKALDDPTVKAIFCSRGGYGSVHLVDQLDFTHFKAHPKWLIGFSDITLLHQLFQSQGYVSLHAPMAQHLATYPQDAATTLLKNTLEGQLPHYRVATHPYNRQGQSTGLLRGGNLSVLYGMRSTPYDIPAPNTILFIEDVGERPYHIDRMMNNLRLSGVLRQLSGLIVGQFTAYDEDPNLGYTVYEMIQHYVSAYDYPVCFNFPVGHVQRNYPLITGSQVSLHVTANNVHLNTLPPSTTEGEERRSLSL